MYNTYHPDKLPPIKTKDYHKVETTGVRLPRVVKQKVAQLAKNKGVSMSVVMTKAIEEYLDKHLKDSFQEYWDKQADSD